MRTFLFAALAVALALTGTSTAALAADQDLHPDVAYAMDAVPGGTIIDDRTVVWPEFGMELTVPDPFARAVGTCATGAYCAYSGPNRSGTKLSWGVCSTVSTAALATVGSVANARASGTVRALNAAAVVLGSAPAGSSINVGGGTKTLRCYL